MKQTDYNNSSSNPDFNQLQSINKKKQLFSNHLNDVINSLTNPRFLGSIHMKKATSTNNSLENLVENELQLKTTKALKNTLFNPVTKILIILAIVFNLLWFLFATIL
ncbi:MAG: hypothetical protein R3255_10145 [Candidatus Lokiarchaeia archaeon]|nr:hypothetical protein [Candidatus Lokiarchaeia archaeon]